MFDIQVERNPEEKSLKYLVIFWLKLACATKLHDDILNHFNMIQGDQTDLMARTTIAILTACQIMKLYKIRHTVVNSVLSKIIIGFISQCIFIARHILNMTITYIFF